MKKYSFTFFICCLFTAISFNVKAQEAAKEAPKSIVIVGVYQSLNPEFSKIVITENSAVVEEYKIEPISQVSLTLNQVETTKALTKYLKEGYKLISDSSNRMVITNSQQSASATMFIMEK